MSVLSQLTPGAGARLRACLERRFGRRSVMAAGRKCRPDQYLPQRRFQQARLHHRHNRRYQPKTEDKCQNPDHICVSKTEFSFSVSRFISHTCCNRSGKGEVKVRHDLEGRMIKGARAQYLPPAHRSDLFSRWSPRCPPLHPGPAGSSAPALRCRRSPPGRGGCRPVSCAPV